jgi:DeoR/GlpR family transcriptional regulator of sugar metabolism
MSQRKAAEALGVSQMTVQRDLKQNGSESEPQCFTTDRAERREAANRSAHWRVARTAGARRAN